MPDLPTTSSRSVSSMQRWHSLKNVGGCMSGFSQMFHLTKMLGGSTSNYRPTSAAGAQSSENQTQSGSIGKPNSAKAERMQGAEVIIDLRRMLNARQEPFVLQDIIWEKRHPVRTQSSRELKFDFNEIKFSSEKAESSKRRSSKDKRRHSDASFDGVVTVTPQKNGMASSVLVKGSNIPAENNLILPSSQATPYVRKTISSSQKMSMAAKSPVKSPNKKALLMEAAVRILEGSNRQTCRRSSSSARSLLRELDESKQAQGGLASKEPVINKQSMVDECAIEGKSVNSPEENGAEGKTFTHIDVNNCFSFLDQSQRDLPGSLNGDFERTDEEVMGTMQGRIYPFGGMPTESQLLMELAAVPETPQQPIHVQETDSHFSSGSEMQHETLNTAADASTEGTPGHVGQRQSEDQTFQGADFIMVSETAVEHERQCDKDAFKDMSRDLELALHEDQGNNTFVGEVPSQMLLNSCKPPECYQMEIAKHCYESEVAFSEKTTVDAVEYTNDAASNGCSETMIESVNDADALDSSDIFTDEAINLFKGNGGKQVFCRERSDMPDAMENATTPILLLCNFSWWTQGNIQVPSIAPKDETLYECAGYDSLTASYEDHSAVKMFGDNKGGENDEDGSPASPNHSYVEEFQQSSPVSVLDAVYDDNSSLGKPFDYFEEARQKLLESVRRYEMLMHMDIDALITMNKENLCHEYEDESDSPSHEEHWGSDSHDIFANDHPYAVISSPNDQLTKYSCPTDDKDENLGCNRAIGYEAIDDDLDSCSNEGLDIKMLADKDSRGKSDFGVAAKARVIAERESSRRCKAFLDCSSEPSDSAALEGLRCVSTSLNNCFRETSGEIETGSDCINAMLQADLKTSSWSTFNEEMEALEKELEISLFKALMRELLSDLQCQASNEEGWFWLKAHVCPTPG